VVVTGVIRSFCDMSFGHVQGAGNEVYVKLSYEPRWMTYFLGIGMIRFCFSIIVHSVSCKLLSFFWGETGSTNSYCFLFILFLVKVDL